MEDKILTCPQCGSEKVRVLACSAYDANSGDFVVHSHKTQDCNTFAYCGNYSPDCNWKGLRNELVEL